MRFNKLMAFIAIAILAFASVAAIPATKSGPPDIDCWGATTLLQTNGNEQLWLYEDIHCTLYPWDMYVVYNTVTEEIVCYCSSDTVFEDTSTSPPTTVDIEDMPDVKKPGNPSPTVPPGDPPLPTDPNGNPIPLPAPPDYPDHDQPIFWPGDTQTNHPVYSVAVGTDTIYYRYTENDSTGDMTLCFVEGSTGTAATQVYAAFYCVP